MIAGGPGCGALRPRLTVREHLMKTMERKDFDKEAKQWEDPFRTKLAGDVADAISREVKLSKDMDVMDFGCGTGLVTLRLQPLVRSITGVDSSPGMLAVLEEKIRTQGLKNIRPTFVDFEKGDLIAGQFHLIACSMTLHHIPDVAALFRLWFEKLLPGGRLCFADLDTEDGSFHPDNTGVFHFGFDRAQLKKLLYDTDFAEVRDTTATVLPRPVKGKGICDFPVFLIIAGK